MNNNENLTILDNPDFLDLPKRWQPKHGKVFDFTTFKSILICRYRLEDHRMILFQNVRENLGVALSAGEIISLRRALDFHWLTDYPVKIEPGDKLITPEMPEE